MNIIKKNKLINLCGFAALRDFINNSLIHSCKFVKFVDFLFLSGLILLSSILISCSAEKDPDVLASIGDVEISVE